MARGDSVARRDTAITSPEPDRWPPVTVVVPTLGDRADVLEQALRGIHTQHYPGPIECTVVLDRRSPDARPDGVPPGGSEADAGAGWRATRVVAEAWGCHVIDNTRTPGLAGARNSGILAASGELVAFCDDDDHWLPEKLQKQVSALLAEPGSTLACCGITVRYGDLTFERVHPAARVSFRELLASRLMALHVSSFLARRSALLEEIGLVCEELPGSRFEDYELLLRAARAAAIVNVPEPLVHVQWHTQRRTMYGRWAVVVRALPWLLERYPEFRSVPRGYARIAGQMSFAAAASGNRRMAWRWGWLAIRARPRELRPYIAFGVTVGVVNPDRVIRWLHRRGRGL